MQTLNIMVCCVPCRYVEKRMLEEQISHLNSEIVERDTLDSQIQSCVCGLFERINALEAENAELRR